MIFSTTTAIDHDEELLNRCLTVGVDDARAGPVRSINCSARAHARRPVRRQAKSELLKQHQNAQRY